MKTLEEENEEIINDFRELYWEEVCRDGSGVTQAEAPLTDWLNKALDFKDRRLKRQIEQLEDKI